jgi:serine/threonine protein kinase
MLMNLVQGGELYNIIHNAKRRASMAEDDAKFYAAGVHEALGYMHRRGFVYRDLKPGVYGYNRLF